MRGYEQVAWSRGARACAEGMSANQAMKRLGYPRGSVEHEAARDGYKAMRQHLELQSIRESVAHVSPQLVPTPEGQNGG